MAHSTRHPAASTITPEQLARLLDALADDVDALLDHPSVRPLTARQLRNLAHDIYTRKVTVR